MFGQVLDKLGTFFGPSFLLARYVPWLLCALANAIFACLEFPAARAMAIRIYTDAGGKAVDVAIALLAIWVVAYATAPLIEFATRLLEGGWIPRWLDRLTLPVHALQRDRLERAYRVRFERRAVMPDLSQIIEGLRHDRSIGARYRKIGDERAIEQAAEAIDRLRVTRWRNRPVEHDEFERAVQLLSNALQRNCAESQWFIERREKTLAARLHELHQDMWRTLAPYSLDIAAQTEARAYGERDRQFADKELAPTRLGNDAAALRSYCETRYGFEFDFFWPRFLLVMQKDEKLSKALATAKMQLDFSVLAWMLSTTTVAFWAIFLAGRGASLWTVLLVVGIGPLAVRAWLEIVHTSYSSFAEVVRSAIDLRRFDVLAALHQPLPASGGDEKLRWDAVTRVSVLGNQDSELEFKHPAA